MLNNNLRFEEHKFMNELEENKLLQFTIESLKTERKKIASELHDKVGAMLSAAKLNLGMIQNGTIPKEEYEETVANTKQIIDDAIETVRHISKDLLPAPNNKR